jgi:hypothetical protein
MYLQVSKTVASMIQCFSIMSIPNSQLETWTNQGSTTNSALTHNVLRNALSRYDWSNLFGYTDYLQGSYANTTNIRGESDVDIVIECNSIFYNNLTENEKQRLGFTKGNHDLDDFKNEVVDALISYYGNNYVDTSGANSIKVLRSDTNNRLYADVIVCASYRHYESLRLRAEGITFWNKKNSQIINYPKLHKSNGAIKNSNAGGCYKQTVRMFKNARKYMTDGDAKLKKKFPSYFVECLIYNVPNKYFYGNTWQIVFVDILNYLIEVFDEDNVENFTTQSGMHYLIGNSSVQWCKSDAQDFVNSLLNLWENYYG